jgi:xylan 1,4-beta-xylosidase
MPATIHASIKVSADASRGPYRPIWNWFGHDEPNYTYSRNGRKLLADLTALSPAPIRIRTHNLLTSGDGTAALKWGSTNAYREDPQGQPLYDWTIMDRIFDAYRETGVVPFVQIGFMPEALSSRPQPYRHSFPAVGPQGIKTGWAAPPNDYGKWAALIEAWAGHLAERYGKAVAASWPWEVWNEPDGNYWMGSVEEYCRLYDVSVAALARVLPDARVGGPHTCGAHGRPAAGPFLRRFLEHCLRGPNGATGGRGTRLDFVGCHAKGRPMLHDGHIRMGLRRHLNDIDANLRIVKEFPELGPLPVILGESDPEGCAACSARTHPENAYRNGPLYGAYVVEAIARTYELSRLAGVDIEGSVTWAFLFEDQPYFDGFRDLATNGIDKAVLNAFRMLGMLKGAWIDAASSHARPLASIMADGVADEPDINVLATRDGSELNVLVWHYHDDDAPGPDAMVTLDIANLPASADRIEIRHFRMDDEHSNAYRIWQAMGSPQALNASDHARLQAAAGLQILSAESRERAGADGVRLAFALPRQAVSLIQLRAPAAS